MTLRSSDNPSGPDFGQLDQNLGVAHPSIIPDTMMMARTTQSHLGLRGLLIFFYLSDEIPVGIHIDEQTTHYFLQMTTVRIYWSTQLDGVDDVIAEVHHLKGHDSGAEGLAH